MKAFLIFGTFLVLAKAQYPQYGAPGGYPSGPAGYSSPPGRYSPPGGYSSPPAPQGYPSSGPEEEIEEPIRTVRNIFVYTAPDDESSGQARIIKAPIKRERQVNILFVKAPAPAAPDQQIVDIPNDGGRKTLVYVLLKKTEATPDVDFKLPGPTPPSKPEIYFIRYKDNKDQKVKSAPGEAAPEYGPPAANPAASAQPQYGVPGAAVPEGYTKK